MARIKDTSVRDVIDAANIVDVVGLRTSLRKSSGTRYMGRCPFHEERSPSFSVNADLNLYHCFGCGKGGDVVTFVRETEGLDFVGAIEWLAERFRVPLEYEESSPQADESRRRRERLYAVLDQAASFFERHLWEGADGEPVRAYLASRGLGEEIAKEFRLGLSPGPRPGREGAREGVHGRRAARRRADEPARQRLLPAAPDVPARGRARPGDRLPGTQAPRRRPAQGQVRQLARERALQEEQRPLRPPPRAARDREAGPGRRRRGQHRRDRAAAGGVRAGRRLDGDGAHRAAPARARPADEAAVPLLRRRRGRRGGDAPRHGAGAAARGSRSGSSCCRRARIRPTRRPASSSGSARPRATSTTASGSSSTAPSDRQEAFVRAREILAKAEDSPERQEALRLVADRLDLPRETLSGIAPARGAAAAAGLPTKASRRSCSTRGSGSSARRSRRSSRTPAFARRSPGSARSTSTSRSTGGCEPSLVARSAARRRSRAAARGARRDGVERGDHARTTGTEMLLRLRERKLRRDLQGETDLARATELQAHLAKVRQALTELA